MKTQMKTARALDQIAKQRVVLICLLNEQYFSLINHHNLSPTLPVNFFFVYKNFFTSQFKDRTFNFSIYLPLVKNFNQQNSNLWLFLKYILSWEIKALKQYPLITKEVWIVLEATSKTRASCLTGVSRYLRPRAFICVWKLWSTAPTLVWYITSHTAHNFTTHHHSISILITYRVSSKLTQHSLFLSKNSTWRLPKRKPIRTLTPTATWKCNWSIDSDSLGVIS